MRRAFPALLALSACLAVAGCARTPEPGDTGDAAQKPPVLLDNLGDHTHPIQTSNPRTQRYFDQGLILTFGFNHEAAVRSFEEAGRLDPGCAMCFWGIALALGPNINAPMGPDAAVRAYAAVQKAVALAPAASPREQAYIGALATRYAASNPEDRSGLDLAYANAMREVQRADPADVDAATLLAEALMDLSPWNYWTPDARPREHTPEVLALLEGVLQRDPQHVGANHYYIHAVEEYYPERAVAAADRLRNLAPDAGHLVHMPSHIYWRVGRYDDALEINRRAIAADEAFFSWCRAGAFYRAAYYPHNIHFLWSAAAAEGRSEIALSAARKLAARTSEGVAELPFLQEFIAIPIVTEVRFGHWDAVLGEPRPAEELAYVTGVWHYARGMARLRTSDLAAAGQELAELEATAQSAAARELILAGGTASASDLLAIGASHLAGEISAARGDWSAATTALRRAVALQDELTYMEPPPFYFPTRQALGAVLLQAGQASDAEAVYREDLQQYPKNGWSLYGLWRSLDAQGKGTEAVWAQQGFRTAWARADVELEASRF